MALRKTLHPFRVAIIGQRSDARDQLKTIVEKNEEALPSERLCDQLFQTLQTPARCGGIFHSHVVAPPPPGRLHFDWRSPAIDCLPGVPQGQKNATQHPKLLPRLARPSGAFAGRVPGFKTPRPCQEKSLPRHACASTYSRSESACRCSKSTCSRSDSQCRQSGNLRRRSSRIGRGRGLRACSGSGR